MGKNVKRSRPDGFSMRLSVEPYVDFIEWWEEIEASNQSYPTEWAELEEVNDMFRDAYIKIQKCIQASISMKPLHSTKEKGVTKESLIIVKCRRDGCNTKLLKKKCVETEGFCNKCWHIEKKKIIEEYSNLAKSMKEQFVKNKNEKRNGIKKDEAKL
jgi:hypothetical protein